MAEAASHVLNIDDARIFEALMEREALGSTGLGSGVAVPHARLEGLTQMRGVFVRLDQPVAFESVDEQPVDLIFALFAPPNASSEHLRALARVSRMLRQGDLREHLRQASVRAMWLRTCRSCATWITWAGDCSENTR